MQLPKINLKGITVGNGYADCPYPPSHHVPQLPICCCRGPQAGNEKINLKGIAVGNGYADWQLDFNMNVPFARYTSPMSNC